MMADATTIPELLNQRATAGARYAAAIDEMQAALVDLAAIETVLQARDAIPQGGSQTFATPPEALPWSLSHAVYAPRYAVDGQPIQRNWQRETLARRDELIKSLADRDA